MCAHCVSYLSLLSPELNIHLLVNFITRFFFFFFFFFFVLNLYCVNMSKALGTICFVVFFYGLNFHYLLIIAKIGLISHLRRHNSTSHI